MKYASATPYTEAERARDQREHAAALEIVHIRRKVLKSGQNYNVPATKASIRKDRAIMGEREAS